jgi:hypothetical protein
MKKITAIIFMGMVVIATSCKKYFDINTNPNSATSATPELILPQALTATASNVNGYNSYGSQLVGYMANAGGYGGFGTSITYNFSSSDFQGRWSTSYNNLEDYQYILDQTDAQLPLYSYFNAAARVMKAYNFQLLVDAYNDVPYSQALKGGDVLTPAYGNAAEIYDSLAVELDKAIATINEAENNAGATIKDMGAYDVMFHGDMTMWKELANTIKLRLIVRANGKVNFSNTSFDEAGFLTDDALINPGYTLDVNRQNPQWENWAFTSTGGAGNKAWMPNTYVYGYYNGTKLLDTGRGNAIYYQFPNTGTNRLGIESNSIQSSPTGSFWYSGTDRNPSTAGNVPGVLKGPDAGYPLMTAAESYFLQSEAVVRGILTSGDASELFYDGIKASFHYLYELPDGAIQGDPVSDETQYEADNKNSYLVNFALANTTDKKIEAIITQKYIALNFIAGHETWNEYRRTHYPKIIASDNTGYYNFASPVSESTQPDKLPTRILYPTSEGANNSVNVPKNISPFTSFIFWALQ